MVARPGQKIRLRYRMLGNVDEGRIIRSGGAGLIPLTDEGNGVFSVDVTAPTPTPRDVFSPILGEVRGYVGPESKCFNNSFVNVITDEVPRARIVSLAADAQRSDYVVNIAVPTASLPSLDALTFAFDAPAMARRFYQLFPDDFDMLNFVLPGFYENRYHLLAKNSDQGTAASIFNNTSVYGSKGRLLGVNVFPLFPYFDGADRGATHEIGHQWLAFFPRIPYAVPPHWPPSSMANGIMGFGHTSGTQGLEFPCLISKKNGVVTATRQAAGSFTDMDLYVMGLTGPEAVGEQYIVTDQNLADAMPGTCGATLSSGQYAVLTVQDLIRDYGARVPAASSPKTLRIANILLTRDTLADADTMALADFFARRFQERWKAPTKVGLARRPGDPLYTATGGRMTASTQLTTTAMPEIGAGGIVNSGNFAADQHLAPGTVTSIFGTNMARSEAVAATVPLPTTLGGVQVLVNGKPAPLFYVSPTQINFQLPWELSTANETFADSPDGSYQPIYTIRVQDGDLSSNLSYLTGQKDSPQVMVYGANLAVAQDSSWATIGPSNPAKPRDTITVYLLGVNSFSAAPQTGAASPDNLIRFAGQVSAWVGSQAAAISFSGLTPQGVGLEQVNLEVPFLQPGSYDLKISVNGNLSNTVKLFVGAR